MVAHPTVLRFCNHEKISRNIPVILQSVFWISVLKGFDHSKLYEVTLKGCVLAISLVSNSLKMKREIKDIAFPY